MKLLWVIVIVRYHHNCIVIEIIGFKKNLLIFLQEQTYYQSLVKLTTLSNSIIHPDAKYFEANYSQIRLKENIDEVCHAQSNLHLKNHRLKNEFMVDENHKLAYCRHGKVRCNKEFFLLDNNYSEISNLIIFMLRSSQMMNWSRSCPVTESWIFRTLLYFLKQFVGDTLNLENCWHVCGSCDQLYWKWN